MLRTVQFKNKLLQLNNKKTAQLKNVEKDLSRFSKEKQMASKHMKGFSTSLAGREKQIKATASYHFTPTKMARIKKTTGVGKDGENPHLLQVGM